MKNNAKGGKSNDKIVLIILAILIVVVVAVLIAVNAGKNPSDSTNGDNTNNEAVIPNGPAIEGTENVSVSGNVKTNVSSALKGTKTFEIYTLSDISLESVSGNTTLTATVSANVTEKVAGKPIVIKFYDKNGNVVETMNAYMPQVKPGENSTLSAQSTTDLANAYDMVIENKK